MAEKLKENRLVILLLLTGAVYFFLRVIAPLSAPILLAMLFVTIFGPLRTLGVGAVLLDCGQPAWVVGESGFDRRRHFFRDSSGLRCGGKDDKNRQ